MNFVDSETSQRHSHVEKQWFWGWLRHGDDTVEEDERQPGYRKIANRWIFLHLTVGATLSGIAPASLNDAASSFLLPLAGIFIGIAFAWAGNAQTLLQTPEIEQLANYPGEGFKDWVYEYQLTVLLLLVTLVLWGVSSLGVYDELWPTPQRAYLYWVVGLLLYTLASLSLRGCWRAVMDTQNLLVTRYRARQIQHDQRRN